MKRSYPPAGGPIVILHGWGASSKSFQEVKELLREGGFKVLVPNLPGFEGTPLLKKTMTFDDYIDFVKDFIQKNNLAKVILLGHSFGGRIAIKFTSLYNNLVEKLILVGASGIRHPLSLKRRFAYALTKIGKIVFSVPPFSFLSPFFRKLIYYWIGEWDYYKSGPLLETFKNVYKVDIKPYLTKIKVPTLIVWGEEDQVTPLSDGEYIQKKIDKSKLVVVGGGAHDLPYKMPHVFVEKILSFLKS